MLTPYEAIEVVHKLSGFMYYDLDGYLPTDPTLFAITLHDPDFYASATVIEYQFDKKTNDNNREIFINYTDNFRNKI